jgi:transposase
MNAAKIINLPDRTLRDASKNQLMQMVMTLRKELRRFQSDSAAELAMVNSKLAEREAELAKLAKQEINRTTNQPSSKQPEFNKETGEKKPRKRGKGRPGRKGAGNRAKPEADVVTEVPLLNCPECGTDLSDQTVIETNSRIVEDIAPTPEKTVVSEEIQERKWCSLCSKVVSSSSEAALPRSDIGLRAQCLIAYLWVASAMPFPAIAALLNQFFRLRLSTAGLSRMMIRLGKIFGPVHDEILGDVKGGAIIFADETGWRVKGVLWWLWIFANERTAYYWPDKQRGSPVVEKLLGTIFSGVLVTDAWCAYNKIVCGGKQTCMAHIMRKIRKFRDAYPQYYSLVLFYHKLKRILADGERLKLARTSIGEEAFARRLGLLKIRLNKLLAWKNPNKILKEVIAKVARQVDYILTFVEHPGVPKHNNFGEYIIKKGILKRKVSGGSMSEEGAMAYAVLQSIAQTCHLRGLSFLGFLTASLIQYIRTGSPMLLSEYEKQNLKASEKKAA